MLDLVFAKDEEVPVTLLYKAYVLRADIAVAMDDLNAATTYIRQAESLSLSDQELEEVAEAAERLDELRTTLEQG